MASGLSRSWLLVCGLLLLAAPVFADDHVTVVADASDAYLERRAGGGGKRVETYVIMETRPYGSTTADASLMKFGIRDIAKVLAPELARARYYPAVDLKKADLILAVHWGATTPRETTDDMLANTSVGLSLPSRQEQQESAGLAADMNVVIAQQARFQDLERSTDLFGGNMGESIASDLLGYTSELRKLTRTPFATPTEEMLLSDLTNERYFVIVNAYDLRAPHVPGKRPRPVWTIHLNMRSAGQDFSKALARMSNVAVDYFGQRVDGVTTVRPSVHKSDVIIGPVTIIGIEK